MDSTEVQGVLRSVLADVNTMGDSQETVVKASKFLSNPENPCIEVSCKENLKPETLAPAVLNQSFQNRAFEDDDFEPTFAVPARNLNITCLAEELQNLRLGSPCTPKKNPFFLGRSQNSSIDSCNSSYRSAQNVNESGDSLNVSQIEVCNGVEGVESEVSYQNISTNDEIATPCAKSISLSGSNDQEEELTPIAGRSSSNIDVCKSVPFENVVGDRSTELQENSPLKEKSCSEENQLKSVSPVNSVSCTADTPCGIGLKPNSESPGNIVSSSSEILKTSQSTFIAENQAEETETFNDCVTEALERPNENLSIKEARNLSSSHLVPCGFGSTKPNKQTDSLEETLNQANQLIVSTEGEGRKEEQSPILKNLTNPSEDGNVAEEQICKREKILGDKSVPAPKEPVISSGENTCNLKELVESEYLATKPDKENSVLKEEVSETEHIFNPEAGQSAEEEFVLQEQINETEHIVNSEAGQIKRKETVHKEQISEAEQTINSKPSTPQEEFASNQDQISAPGNETNPLEEESIVTKKVTGELESSVEPEPESAIESIEQTGPLSKPECQGNLSTITEEHLNSSGETSEPSQVTEELIVKPKAAETSEPIKGTQELFVNSEEHNSSQSKEQTIQIEELKETDKQRNSPIHTPSKHLDQSLELDAETFRSLERLKASKQKTVESNRLSLDLAQEEKPLDSFPEPEEFSEAGPATTSEEIFCDPASFDFLVQRGSNVVNSNLYKKSLFVRFDPLVNAQSPSQIEKHLTASLKMADENCENEKNISESKKSTSPVTPLKNPPLEAVDKLISQESSPTVPGVDSSALNAELAKLRELLVQQEKEYKEKIQKMEKNEANLKKELSEKTSCKNQLSTLLNEYEKTMSQMVTQKEAWDAKFKGVESERDTTLQHLNTLEMAFSDVHQKYERCKAVIESLKQNEDALKASVQEYDIAVKKLDNRYEMLKQHAKSQLDKANQELDVRTKSHEAESAKLRALLKKSEIKITSLEQSLEQKTKENQELMKICDELINKVGTS